jgi:CRISPR-associated protein Cas2
MPLVVVVTRDVADRVRGFLGSVMLEVSPAVYISPRMNKGSRERVWQVLRDWHHSDPRGSAVMVWRDVNEIGGVGLSHLGEPPRELVEQDGMWLPRIRRARSDL